MASGSIDNHQTREDNFVERLRMARNNQIDLSYNTGVPQLHPEYARLLEEVRLLRDQLVRLLQERDDLLSTVISNLEAQYYTVLGKQQYDLFCLECEVRRIKRKIELIQAAFNRMETVNLKVIDTSLDEEMFDWNRQMKEMSNKLEYAGQLASAVKMSAEEQKELQKLYFVLAKKAHPDLNPDQTERLSNLWLQISAA
jgi:hypothetical protein